MLSMRQCGNFLAAAVVVCLGCCIPLVHAGYSTEVAVSVRFIGKNIEAPQDLTRFLTKEIVHPIDEHGGFVKYDIKYSLKRRQDLSTIERDIGKSIYIGVHNGTLNAAEESKKFTQLRLVLVDIAQAQASFYSGRKDLAIASLISQVVRRVVLPSTALSSAAISRCNNVRVYAVRTGASSARTSKDLEQLDLNKLTEVVRLYDGLKGSCKPAQQLNLIESSTDPRLSLLLARSTTFDPDRELVSLNSSELYSRLVESEGRPGRRGKASTNHPDSFVTLFWFSFEGKRVLLDGQHQSVVIGDGTVFVVRSECGERCSKYSSSHNGMMDLTNPIKAAKKSLLEAAYGVPPPESGTEGREFEFWSALGHDEDLMRVSIDAAARSLAEVAILKVESELRRAEAFLQTKSSGVAADNCIKAMAASREVLREECLYHQLKVNMEESVISCRKAIDSASEIRKELDNLETFIDRCEDHEDEHSSSLPHIFTFSLVLVCSFVLAMWVRQSNEKKTKVN